MAACAVAEIAEHRREEDESLRTRGIGGSRFAPDADPELRRFGTSTAFGTLGNRF
jgi:hypothetical protein